MANVNRQVEERLARARELAALGGYVIRSQEWRGAECHMDRWEWAGLAHLFDAVRYEVQAVSAALDVEALCVVAPVNEQDWADDPKPLRTGGRA